jgi:hypothetical protein
MYGYQDKALGSICIAFHVIFLRYEKQNKEFICSSGKVGVHFSYMRNKNVRNSAIGRGTPSQINSNLPLLQMNSSFIIYIFIEVKATLVSK